MKRRFRRVFMFFGILLLLFPIACYVFREPIKTEMNRQLEAQMIKNGIHASYTVSNFNWLSGLILDEISIFKTEEKQIPVLELNRITVNYDLVGLLFSGGSSAVNLSTNDSVLTLWEDGESYTIADITSDMRVSRSRIRLDEFRASYRDVRVNLTADIDPATAEADRKRRKAERKAQVEKSGTKKDEKKKKSPRGIRVEEAMKWLKQIPDTPDGDVVITLNYEFISDAESPSLKGRIMANQLNWKRLTLADLSVVLDSTPIGKRESAIVLQDMRFKMGDRAFSMAGKFNPISKMLTLDRLESTIDPKAVLDAVLDKPLEKPLPPIPSHRITAAGIVDVENPLASTIRGRFETFSTFLLPVENGRHAPIAVDSVKTEFGLAQNTARVMNLDVMLQTMAAPVSISGTASAVLGADGKAAVISLEGIVVERDGGSLAVVGEFAPEEKILRFKQLKSDLDFVSVLTDLGQDDPLKGKIRYSRPPIISATGLAALENPAGNDLRGTISLNGTTEIDMAHGKKTLMLHSLDSDFVFSGTQLTIPKGAATFGDAETPTSLVADLTMNFRLKKELTKRRRQQLEMTTLKFGPLHAERDGGKLEGEGIFDAVAKNLSLTRMEADLDMMAMLGEFGTPNLLAGKISFPKPPKISLIGEIAFAVPEATELKGHIISDTGLAVAIGEKSEIHVNRFEIPQFSVSGSMISVPQILATTGPAESPISLEADVKIKTGVDGKLEINQFLISRAERSLVVIASMPLPVTEIKLIELKSDIDILAAMADFGGGEPTGGKVKFKDPPLIVGEGVINIADMTKTEAYGSVAISSGFSIVLDENRAITVRDFNGGECKFDKNGLMLVGLSAVLDAAKSPVTVKSDLELRFSKKTSPALVIKGFTATRGDKKITLDGVLPFAEKKLIISQLNSTLDPISLLADLGIGDPTMGKVVFKAPPVITLNGELAFTDALKKSKLQGSIQAPSGLLLPLQEGQTFDVTTFETTFGIGNGMVTTPKLVAELFGGKLQANTRIDPAISPLQFESALRFTDMHLDKITSFFNLDEKRTGLISAEFNGGGLATLQGVEGTGMFNVREARLVSLPLFRGLRPLLLAINLGEWKAEDSGVAITSNYILNQGILTSDDIELLGDFYRVKSKMSINLPQKTMVAEGALSTTGASRVITEIVGKILEVKAEGPFDGIKWRLNTPDGDALKDIATLPIDLLKTTLVAAARPGKLIQDAGAAAKDTLQGMGKKLLGGFQKKPPQPVIPTPTEPTRPAPTQERVGVSAE